jgi:DNA mismatch repair protein MutL
MTALALAHLSAGFRLESNGRTLMELPAATDLAGRAASLWGDEFAGALVPVAHGANGIDVAGLVERPDAAVSGPRRVHLFVAGRPFRDRGLVEAAERGYRTTVPRGARPSMLLYMEVPDGGVDVNVHPSKAEVRFGQGAAVEEAVEAAVREAMATVESAATLDRRPALPQIRAASAPGSREETAPAGAEGQLAFFVATAPRGSAEAVGTKGDAAEAAGVDEERRHSLWQVHDTYIVVETRSGLLIIDQHSAHERILFEELMRDFDAGGRPSQRLLFPITLRLSPAEYAVAEDTQALLERTGFATEPFGGRTVIVHAAPNPHPWFDAERCLREMLAELAEGSELTRAARNQYERLAMTFACKGAIKAGQKLSREEMHELFEKLFATELPYHDVHGRPTIVRLSIEELERRFGRHG